MFYSKEYLQKIIEASCSKLKNDQPMLFDPKSDVNERTVSGELAGLMRKSLKGFHVNCEYNRMTNKYGKQIPKKVILNPNHPKPTSVYPDIIIHKQEDKEHNLLIVEIKMAWKNDKKIADYDKLNRYIQELGYQYGLYLELGEEGILEMKWFEK